MNIYILQNVFDFECIWRCHLCQTLNNNINHCIGCKQEMKSEDVTISIPKYDKINALYSRSSWFGDTNRDHIYYQAAASFCFKWFTGGKNENFGTEIPIPYYSKNGQKTDCYQNELFWLGLCPHLFVQSNAEKQDAVISEIQQLYTSDIEKNQKKID